MKLIVFLMIMASSMYSQEIFDFNKKSNLNGWNVVDDVVMGGRSAGSFGLDSDGNGIFSGAVSLENYGGFSSVRYNFEKTSVKGYSHIVLKVKGDGKKYQIRIKEDRNHYYSFISYFSTDGEWQEITIPLHDMYPTFRGRELDMPNFSGDHIEELAFLIGNKKPEKFQLLIDKIELK